MTAARRTFERWEAAFASCDADALAELYHADAVMEHPFYPMGLRGRDAIGSAWQGLFESFGEVQLDVRTVLADETTVATEAVIRATNVADAVVPRRGGLLSATGRTTEIAAAQFLEVDAEGAIVVERRYFDTADLMEQLGV